MSRKSNIDNLEYGRALKIVSKTISPIKKIKKRPNHSYICFFKTYTKTESLN